jgi:hypothetical protein
MGTKRRRRPSRPVKQSKPPIEIPNARTALLKAQYFLDQAMIAEADPKILADPNRLPFAANLEAAIIYARSSIDYLHSEFAPMYKSKGYRKWHDQQWKKLCTSNPVCSYFAERRNFIVHEESEKTTAHVFLQGASFGKQSTSVSMTAKRADGTTEKPISGQPAKQPALSVPDNPPEPPKSSPSRASQQFFLAEPALRDKPAIAYVGDFIDAIRKFISDAEAKFQF